jgi:hypothetical protein
MRYRIRKADHEKAKTLFAEVIEYQHSHPEIYYYTRSRSFFMEAPDNADEEIWMFIDEYDDREKYWNSLVNALANDPKSEENKRRYIEMIVQDSLPKEHEVWTEVDELRVEFDR